MSKNELVADLNSRTPDYTKGVCGVTRLIQALEGDERSAVENALIKIQNDPGQGRSKVYSSSWLASVLRKNGHIISSSTISRHLKGGCRCE